MLQISIVILFQIFLKISSLCSILFLLFYHYSPLTSKLLCTFSYNTAHKNFPRIPKLMQSNYFFLITNVHCIYSTLPEIEMIIYYCAIFLSDNSFILTYYAYYFTQVSIFSSRFSCIASYLTVKSYTYLQLYSSTA